MITTSLSKIAHIVNGKLIGEDKTVNAVSIDSRKIKSGELFIAILGLNFDGHDFVEDAFKKEASAALVSKEINSNIPQIVVKDTRIALGLLAKYQRQQMPKPLLAVTGSCGKTSTRAMLASIMEQCGNVLQSQGSFNNDIGLPLTLLEQTEEHDFIVLEMGTNHFGEIAYLSEIATPNVACVLNIGRAHLEYLKNLEGVCKAKAEIFVGLENEGIAVINNDDTFAEDLKKAVGNKKIITFGIKNPADITAKNIRLDQDGQPQFELIYQNQSIDSKQLGFGQGAARHETRSLQIVNEEANKSCNKAENSSAKSINICLPFVGEHNISNALGAAACAIAANVNLQQIQFGLNSTKPVAKRMIWRTGKNHTKVLDDSYNAIPNAVHAALDVLAKCDGNKIFVFGGMAEVGELVIEEHANVGLKAKENHINYLFAVGPYSQHTTKAFGENAYWFATKAELIIALEKFLKPNTTILIKGSRGATMEEVVAAITNTDGNL